MKKKTKMIILLLAVGVLIAGVLVHYNRPGEQPEPEQPAAAQTQTSPGVAAPTEPTGFPAPDFTVYDAQNNPVKLSDYFGKPIVLNFWASWCGPCKMEMPDFNEKSQELAGEVQFLMVNMTDGARETVESATEFVQEQGYTFPVFFDTTSEAAYAYSAYSLPTTFFIDAQGNALAQATGAISGETLQRGIDMIYKS